MSSDLWSFSINLYARPGVEAACLALQAEGANVCLVLCGLWLEQRGVTYDEQRLQQLRHVAGPWDAAVVQPLRTLRTRWKDLARQDAGLGSLREQIKKLELEAERQLLERLETKAGDWPKGQDEATAQWLQRLVANAGQTNRDALHRLRVAAVTP
ncbi:TIGR02444 family protein [Pseudomonas sp. Z1-14]|uniref:TIGR02444 family protein n=1 Tax=Pseudomonas sp. Z1-14 TaxID=2817409 RepID=UPI003DA89273